MVWGRGGFSRGLIGPMHPPMVVFSETVWLVLAIFAGVCLLGVGHILASTIFYTTQKHHLKHEVVRLRAYYTAQMEALALGEDTEEIPKDMPGLIEYLAAREAQIIEVGEAPEHEVGDDGVIEVGEVSQPEPARAAA